MKTAPLKDLGKATFQLFFPNQCGACSRELQLKEEFICLHCRQEMQLINTDKHAEKMLASIFKGRVEIQKAMSLFQYSDESETRHIPHKIKYQGHKRLGVYMGKMMGELLNIPKSIDLIIPLPLHYKKERLRGFNQSLCLAEGISEATKIPINNKILKRRVHTKSQTKFTKYERWENVRSIFQMVNPEPIKDKHILLVDDVLTTGATLESAACELLMIPNTKVSIATLAARL